MSQEPEAVKPKLNLKIVYDGEGALSGVDVPSFAKIFHAAEQRFGKESGNASQGPSNSSTRASEYRRRIRQAGASTSTGTKSIASSSSSEGHCRRMMPLPVRGPVSPAPNQAHVALQWQPSYPAVKLRSTE
uniref:Uncharacterized protein n=1 Tax=Mycena chlorophos TaxID=658473 RepID=A0ABQ0L815_MYCCL|nr:predicted protein [Mycena chlorophos]